MLAEAEENGAELVVNYASANAGEFHPQKVDGLGEIYFTLDGNDDTDHIFKLGTDGLDQNSTLTDLLDKLNSELADLAADGTQDNHELLKDVKFVLNEAGTGIAVDNGSNARVTFIDSFQLKDKNDSDSKRIPDAQRLAQDLGLVGPKGEEDNSVTVEAYSFQNAKSLGKNYISRATSLEEFVGKNVIDMGSIRLTNAGGNSYELALGGMRTIGDLVDAINSLKFGIEAEINARGDGITLTERYEAGRIPPPAEREGQIGIQDVEGGVSLAKKLGLVGTGVRNADTLGLSQFKGSLTTSIDVMSTDSLEDIMFRISEAGYKTSVSGGADSGYTLSVSATSTGEKNDFVIESDVPQLDFSQIKRGKDSKVLYGDPDSSGSPRMLSSETNSNSNAINGITLDIKSASAEWTTITVEDDKEQVTEAVKTMVTAYNELSEIIKMLDAYDQETGEEGILFGDNSVRGLMDDINEFFYDVYNPNNVPLGSLDEDGKQQTWTWMDLGISLNAAPSNADGTGGWYNQIDLDEEALTNMVASNWDVMSKMLANERDIAGAGAGDNSKLVGSFNGDLADGFSSDGAVDGDGSRGNFGKTTGIEGADTIENGDNAYTMWFQKSTRVNRMTVQFPSADQALKDFSLEYLDSATGEWKELRPVEGNTQDSISFGFMTENVQADAIRITGKSTNADDGKFRLLNVQIFEEMGLAGRMNQHTTELGDTQFGFLASMNEEIQANLLDIEDQMMNLEEKLTAKEEALWRRFTAMETAMSKLQGQGDYFSSMMASLAPK
jgi:flagellar capping protein FliD